MQLNRLTRNLVLAGVLGGAGFALARIETPIVEHANAAVEQPSATPVVPTAPAAQQIATPQVALPNFTGLVQRYGPAVVNITVTQRAKTAPMMLQRQQQGDDDDDNDPFSQFFRGLPFGPNGPQFQQIPRNGIIQRGLGSGFIVSPDGYIMTNAHVVDGATEVTVKLTDRREYKAKVIGSDKKSDIAVIKIDAKNLPVVSVGNSDRLSVGEWVVAIGSPFGFENTVTAGIVSAKARSLPNDSITPFIQTDVPVNPGNSGGPLFNLNGEVVGINSQIFSESGGFQGISFAIPIDIAMNVKDQLVAHGKVTRARLGVTIQDVNQQLANSFKLPRPMGALVSDVEADGPAAKAGLKSGDVIVKLDGRDIDRSSDLPSRVAALKPGSAAHVEVWRNGKPQDITVSLGELKDATTVAKADTGNEGGRLGVAVRPLRPEEAKPARRRRERQRARRRAGDRRGRRSGDPGRRRDPVVQRPAGAVRGPAEGPDLEVGRQRGAARAARPQPHLRAGRPRLIDRRQEPPGLGRAVASGRRVRRPIAFRGAAMDSSFRRRIAAGLFTVSFAVAGAGAAMVADAQAPMPQPQTQGSVTYLSGGAGSEEVDYIKSQMKDYTLALLFSAKGGDYAANVAVVGQGRPRRDRLRGSVDRAVPAAEAAEGAVHRGRDVPEQREDACRQRGAAGPRAGRTSPGRSQSERLGRGGAPHAAGELTVAGASATVAALHRAPI